MIIAKENNYLETILKTDYVSRIDSVIDIMSQDKYKMCTDNFTDYTTKSPSDKFIEIELDNRFHSIKELKLEIVPGRIYSTNSFRKINDYVFNIDGFDHLSQVNLEDGGIPQDGNKVKLRIDIDKIIRENSDRSFNNLSSVNNIDYKISFKVRGLKKNNYSIYYNTLENEFTPSFTPGFSLGPISIKNRILYPDINKEEEYRDAIVCANSKYYDKILMHEGSPFSRSDISNILLLDYGDNERLEFINSFKGSKSFKKLMESDHKYLFENLNVDIEYTPIKDKYNNSITNEVYFSAIKRAIFNKLNEDPEYDILNSNLIKFLSENLGNKMAKYAFDELVDYTFELTNKDYFIVDKDYIFNHTSTFFFKVFEYNEIYSVEMIKDLINPEKAGVNNLVRSLVRDKHSTSLMYTINPTDDELKELDILLSSSLISLITKEIIKTMKNKVKKVDINEAWDDSKKIVIKNK